MNISQAAQILFDRRTAGEVGARLPEECRPTTIKDALAIQKAVTALALKAGLKIAGWKCLLPPDQQKVVVAPVFDNIVSQEMPCALRALNGQAAIEPEIAFVFGQDLPAKDTNYTQDEVFAAIKERRMAFELIGSRYTAPDECEFPELLADSLFNQGIFLGPVIQDAPAAMKIDFAGGFNHHVDGSHPNNDTQAPLVWLTNFLNKQQLEIKAGQAVITGSFAGVVNLPFDTDFTMTYEGLGSLQGRFVEK